MCFWEDDISQLRFPLMGGGANRPSLVDAQKNYDAFGCSERVALQRCRPPTSIEPVDEGWRPLDLGTDNPEAPMPGIDYGGTYPTEPTVLYYWRGSYWRLTR